MQYFSEAQFKYIYITLKLEIPKVFLNCPENHRVQFHSYVKCPHCETVSSESVIRFIGYGIFPLLWYYKLFLVNIQFLKKY